MPLARIRNAFLDTYRGKEEIDYKLALFVFLSYWHLRLSPDYKLANSEREKNAHQSKQVVSSIFPFRKFTLVDGLLVKTASDQPPVTSPLNTVFIFHDKFVDKIVEILMCRHRYGYDITIFHLL